MPLVIGAQVNFAQPDALKGTLVETLKASSLLLCINMLLFVCLFVRIEEQREEILHVVDK